MKGRCLNRLTNGPGSGNLIRTDDIPGMNRLLYQLSYAAMWSKDSGTAEISFIIISNGRKFVKENFWFFSRNLEILSLGDVCMKLWSKAILFYLGGCAYVALELLWRGYSHGSMFVAGGVSVLLVGLLNDVRPRLPMALRAAAGGGIITMVELAAGLAVNRSYAVWDYRGQPGNLWGQICPGFTLVWIVLAAVVLVLTDPLERAVRRSVQ